MFHFSDAFIKNTCRRQLSWGVRLLRLNISLTRAGSKGLFALDNLLGRVGSVDRGYAECEVFLWQGDHVS